MNQNFGTIGIKHTLGLLLMMALEDENHQRLNIPYISTQASPQNQSVGSEAKWLRDLMPVVDQRIYAQVRKLLLGSFSVPGGMVDASLFDQTAKNISLILRALVESYHNDFAVTADDGLGLWDSNCFPHPSCWRMRETVGALLA